MRSVTTKRFRKAYEDLPKKIQSAANKSYGIWRKNTSHPSLHFKQVNPEPPVYSVRVSLGYRALGVKEDDTIIWFWIGSHADYDGLLKSL